PVNLPTIPLMAPVNQTWWRRKRLLLTLAGGVVILMIGFVGLTGYRGSVARRELADAIAEADRLDPGWRFDHLEAERRLPPPNRNAALQVLTAHSALPPRWRIRPASALGEDESYVDDLLWQLPPDRELDHRQACRLRADLERAGSALDQARKLASMPEG